jgi:hypothetical protein
MSREPGSSLRVNPTRLSKKGDDETNGRVRTNIAHVVQSRAGVRDTAQSGTMSSGCRGEATGGPVHRRASFPAAAGATLARARRPAAWRLIASSV